ncbi:hypothetical protein M7I_0469 [Glarea lozoyensis 74030]|uniref:Uncharacterized protein n=1 Tax=Glarea lozoyensis (strain ATCC 74030 / MF5533) TaxID=1104152 RepID=H0EDL4_GLAL7|nr:hypothetical protein M7I_0469 [Glarea lozoyensis 74030]
MYTVDTRASNPENDDPDLAAESAASEATFEYRWWHFTRICSGQCIREYHPWGSRTTVLSISSSNVISTHHIMKKVQLPLRTAVVSVHRDGQGTQITSITILNARVYRQRMLLVPNSTFRE